MWASGTADRSRGRTTRMLSASWKVGRRIRVEEVVGIGSRWPRR
jgi:hypothetical protein